MFKLNLCLLTLWIFAIFNCRFTLARLHKTESAEHEHVHIKVHVPEVLRKHTHQHYKTQRLTRPHYAKRLPAHYAATAVDEDDTQAVFTPYDFKLPAPLPLLTNEHELLAHMGTVLALPDNDITSTNINSKVRNTQLQLLQPQIRFPHIMPPPPLVSPLPTTQALHTGDGDMDVLEIRNYNKINNNNHYNQEVDDDFLKDLQQHMYAYNKHNAPAATTALSTGNVNKKKKRKRVSIITDTNKSNKSNKKIINAKSNNQKYYVNERLEQQYPRLQQGFKPYTSENHAYSNYYDNPNNNNNLDMYKYYSNYGNKQHRFSLMGAPIGADIIDIDAENGSDDEEEQEDQDDDDVNENINVDMNMGYRAFKSPSQQPAESASVENYQQHGDTITHAAGGSDHVFSPVSYQQFFASYGATPATNHLSTLPTRLKYKRQQPMQSQHQQTHPKQVRQQFVQLSSMASPIVASGIDGLHNTILPPALLAGDANIYATTQHSQQPIATKQRYRKRKNRFKVKRNRF